MIVEAFSPKTAACDPLLLIALVKAGCANSELLIPLGNLLDSVSDLRMEVVIDIDTCTPVRLVTSPFGRTPSVSKSEEELADGVDIRMSWRKTKADLPEPETDLPLESVGMKNDTGTVQWYYELRR